jgi:hypothetical protein
MHRFGLVLACLFSLPASSLASPPNPEVLLIPAISPNPEVLAIPPEAQSQARALVEQLGSEDHARREVAQRQLKELGRLARPALLAGASSRCPETRFRCAQLLPRATALDVKARLDTFLADKEGKYEHDLPAWETFRAVACREFSCLGHVISFDRPLTAAAREMFAELYAAPGHRRVLTAIDGPRLELIDLVASRRQELYNLRYARGDNEQPRDPTHDEIAMLLLAESRVGSQAAPRRLNTSYLLSGSGFTTAVRGTDEKGKVYRAIAIAWLNSRNEPRDMYNAIGIATNLDLTDQACGLAAELLAMPGVTARYRGRAASSLVTTGNKTHIPLLEKVIENPVVVASVSSVVTVQGVPVEVYHEIELRDLALAISILLAGKNPDDFGFADRYPDSPDDSQSFSYTRYYFLDGAARKTAFAKWEERRTARDRGP